MRTHTNRFKQEINRFGRQIKGKIIYYNSYNIIAEGEDNILTENDLYLITEQSNYNDPIEINEEDIFQIEIIKNGNLLQSLTKQCNFESKININVGSMVNPYLGVLIDNDYEYLDYGDYIIYSKEYNLDTDTWSYVCYDKMLFSMVKYKGIKNITYPITIKEYIDLLCKKVGLEFEDTNFVNQDELIYEDLYKDKNMTIRDIFDEISKVVGGNLLINNDNKLEVGYVKKAIGKNLFDKSKVTNNRYINSEGDLESSNNYYASDYIKVSDYDNVTLSGNSFIQPTHGAKLAFYDETKNFLSYSNLSVGVNVLSVPNNAYYLKTSIRKTDVDNIQIESGTTVTEYESFGLDTLNDNYLKDINVKMNEKVGVINSVAIYDTESDIQYLAEDTTSIKENGLTRVTITDNLLTSNGNAQEIADNILEKLNGLFYYINDFTTTGACYYDFLDLFNVEARGNIYQCLLLNNEITITQGIEEHIFTEQLEELETSANEYTTSVMTNKQATFKINQQEGKIESKVEKDGIISAINQSAEEIQIQANKIKLEGYTTINDGFQIDTEGNMLANNGTFSGLITAGQIKVAGYTELNPYISVGENFEDPTQPYGVYIWDTGISAVDYRFDHEPLIRTEGPSGGHAQLKGNHCDAFAFNNLSLAEKKENFELLKSGLEILKNIDIYKFNYKNMKKSKKEIGLVIGDDFKYSKEVTNDENTSVNLYSLVAVCCKAIQEQQEEINKLKEVINNGKS